MCQAVTIVSLAADIPELVIAPNARNRTQLWIYPFLRFVRVLSRGNENGKTLPINNQHGNKKMTRYSLAFSIAFMICVGSTAHQIAFGQADEFVQKGEYQLASPWGGTTATPAASSTSTDASTVGSGAAHSAQPLKSYVPESNVKPVSDTQVGPLADIPCGYPSVVTEGQFSGNGWAENARAVQSGYGPGAYRQAAPGAPILGGVETRPKYGLYFNYDALYTTLSAPDIGAIGSPAAEGIYYSNGLPQGFYNTIGTDFIDSKPEFGYRFEFGCLSDCGGWLGSYLGYDQVKQVSTRGGQIQFDDPLGYTSGVPGWQWRRIR